LQSRGVLGLPAGLTVLRLLPPLVTSDNELWQIAEIVTEVINGSG
jgi:acetylornithine/succinyldiaminopimelate/putrescine aminotransferase